MGRGFTWEELKKAALIACGGYANGWYASFDSMLVWEIIETIEIVADLHSDNSRANVFQVLK